MVAAAWSAFTVLDDQPAAVDLAVTFLGAALAHQLPDGTFPWDFNGTANLDPNSVEFISMPLTRVMWHYGSSLPAGFVSQVVPHLELAAQAVLRHQVPVYYTNIYTMRFVNLAMYGQILGNASYTSAASEFIGLWQSLVAVQGLHEYDSPTYTAVAMGNLLSGLASINDTSIVAALQPLVQYALTDIAANTFVPSASMAGSHSRDYDFITGNSGIETYYSLLGLIADADMAPISFSDPITEAQAYVLYVRGEMPWLEPGQRPRVHGGKHRAGHGGLRASTRTAHGAGGLLSSALPAPGFFQSLATIPAGGSRAVQQLWGLFPNNASLYPGMDKYVYCACGDGADCGGGSNGSEVGGGVALSGQSSAMSGVCLGVSGAYYNNPQDKAVSGQLATGQPQPPNKAGRLTQFTKVHDRWDSPYGEVITPDGSGHEKPTHLNFAQAAVQDGGLALVMADLVPEWRSNGRNTNYSSISTAMTLPWNTDHGVWMWQGRAGQPGSVVQVPAQQGHNVSIPMNAPVAVWHGTAALALRAFRIDSINGYNVTCALKFDGPAGSYAGRWVCYHYQGPPVNIPGPSYPASRSAFLLAAAEGIKTPDDLNLLLSALAAYEVQDRGQVDGLWNVTVTPGSVTGRLDSAAGSVGAHTASSACAVPFPGLCSSFFMTLDIATNAGGLRLVNATDYAPRLFRVAFGNGTVVDIQPPASR